MIFRNLDSNHDWVFGRSMSDYAQQLKATELNLVTRILCFLGDCFFDMGAGIDYWNLLDYGGQERLENQIQNTIIQTPDVTGINNFEVLRATNRTLILNYAVTTVWGEIINQLPLLPGAIENTLQYN